MRISDWISDVCSSDLPVWPLVAKGATPCVDDVGVCRADMLQVDLQLLPLVRQVVCEEHVAASRQFVDQLLALGLGHIDADAALAAIGVFHLPVRSDARRVGKEWVSTCRSRWSPYHYKKKKNNI